MSAWEAEGGLVELPDGRRIRGTGLRRPRGTVPVPDFAVYLLSMDLGIEGWPYRWVRWPDFLLPDSTEDAIAALRESSRTGPSSSASRLSAVAEWVAPVRLCR